MVREMNLFLALLTFFSASFMSTVTYAQVSPGKGKEKADGVYMGVYSVIDINFVLK